MSDWMDRIADEAKRQGYGVRQTPKGRWACSKGGDTWTVPGTPVTQPTGICSSPPCALWAWTCQIKMKIKIMMRKRKQANGRMACDR